MQKAHDASKNAWWRDYPDISTPIIKNELNRIETTLDILDDRIIELDITKASQTEFLQSISNVLWNDATGTITFVRWNGSTIVVDTDLEKMPINLDFDDDPTSPHYQNFILTLADGTVKYIDASAFITQYEFEDSDTIAWSIVGGKVVANVKDGSITASKLQPDYLADVTAQANLARNSATSASNYANNANSRALDAEAWAVGNRAGEPVEDDDPTYENNAKYYAGETKDLVDDAMVQIDRKLSLATFDVDSNGNLIYTDNSAFIFWIDNDGDLNWEVE